MMAVKANYTPVLYRLELPTWNSHAGRLCHKHVTKLERLCWHLRAPRGCSNSVPGWSQRCSPLVSGDTVNSELVGITPNK